MARPEEIKYWLIVLMIRTTSSVRAAAQSGRFFLTAFCKLIIIRALATRNPRRSPYRAGSNKVAADGSDDPDDVDKLDAESALMIGKHFCSELVKVFCVLTLALMLPNALASNSPSIQLTSRMMSNLLLRSPESPDASCGRYVSAAAQTILTRGFVDAHD